MEFILNTDGGSRGNPGPGAIGIVLRKGDDILFQKGKKIGETTNNQAEYKALIWGLKESLEAGADELRCLLDSELVVKQLNGEYKVKDEKMKPLFAEVLKLRDEFKKVSFRHVERSANKLADALVNKALDS